MDRPVRIIGAPTDYGANRRGVDMGPSAIRYAGLADTLSAADVEAIEAGDVPAPNVEEAADAAAESREGAVRYFAEIHEVTTRLADRVAAALADDEVPLVLGGDHSVAIGSVGGAARDASVGVVWFDAHGDFNTPETSPSGNVHGMSLAALLGLGSFADHEWTRAPGLRPQNVALVGLRDLDRGERRLLRESPVSAFTMSDVDERGIAAVVEDAVAAATDGTDGIHVSLDLDWLDPTEAPGVGTPVRGGVSYREAHTGLEIVAETGRVRSIDLVEVNPILDHHNETAELATELAASALGKTIL